MIKKQERVTILEVAVLAIPRSPKKMLPNMKRKWGIRGGVGEIWKLKGLDLLY